MSDLVLELALVGFLIVVNAAFAGTELALVSLREGQLRRLERRSAAGALLAGLAREPNRFLATIQIGITLAGFLASAAAAISIAEPLTTSLGFLGGAAEPVAVVAVTLVLAYLTLVFGELAPKRLAMQRAERWALLTARPLALMATLARPAVWLLSVSTDIAVRLVGGDPTRSRETMTEEELRDLVAAHAAFTPKQRLIIEAAFEISERTLREVLCPRGDVFVLDAGEPCSAALQRLAASGHSRAPVVTHGELDTVVGTAHVRDLLTGGGRPVRDVASPPCALPESLGVLNALHELQTRRLQMAIVIEEHGGVAGVVTVEDLLEEIVGEIYDEADRDIINARRRPDGTLVLTGRFPIHDLPDLGVDIDVDTHAATVAGLIIERLGHIPDTAGDTVTIGGFRFTVAAVDGHAITEVIVQATTG